MVPASFDFWRANLNLDPSSAGTSIPSESLNPTAFDLEARRLQRARRDDDVALSRCHAKR
jgi:hypothetical protein